MDNEVTITCHACGETTSGLTGVPDTCPQCGASEGFDAEIMVNDEIRVRDYLHLTGRASPGGKYLDIKQGSSWYAKDGRWHEVVQVVDKRSRVYRKKIVDEETGQVLRDDTEPLSQHIPTAQRRKAGEQGT